MIEKWDGVCMEYEEDDSFFSNATFLRRAVSSFPCVLPHLFIYIVRRIYSSVWKGSFLLYL